MKKQLIAEGKLDKHGKANENTPEAWKAGYVEYMKAVGGAKEGGAAAAAPLVTEVAEDAAAKVWANPNPNSNPNPNPDPDPDPDPDPNPNPKPNQARG